MSLVMSSTSIDSGAGLGGFAAGVASVLPLWWLLLVVPISLAGRWYFQDRDQAPAAPPTPSQAPNAIVPAVRTEGGKAVLPVTFVDGTTAEVVYPKALDLASLGVRPGGSAELVGSCARDFTFPPGGESWFAAAGRPLKQFTGADEQPVVLWPGRSNDVGRYLVFHFGSWWMGVWDDAGGSTMTDEQLATWATHLRGRVTPDGFLVLQAISPCAWQDQVPPSQRRIMHSVTSTTTL
jgi:hypothetical protein